MAEDSIVTIQLRGDRDAIAAFEDLRVFVRGNPFRQSLRAGAEIMLQEIIARAPVLTGKLVSNLRVVLGKRGDYYRARVLVNTLGGAKDAANAFYWRFVEYGHGSVAPVPFVTASFESKNVESAQQVIDAFGAAIDRAEGIANRAGLR